MSAPLLQVRDLVVRYRTSAGELTAVDGANLSVRAGETVALIGESGSGKTSLGKAVVRLLQPSAGQILFEGMDIASLSRQQLAVRRGQIQMVFQDPLSALDPRQRARRALEVPLALSGITDPVSQRQAKLELLEQVELSASLMERYPHELSGGQRQRLNIARALATRPRLLVCDEPVSALDMTLQAQILALLERLQKQLGVAYLFISHDLSVVERFADRIAVMYLGKMVEVLPGRSLAQSASHPYTQLLAASVPGDSPQARRLQAVPLVETPAPSLYRLPLGCRFRDRCPHAVPACAQADPPLRALTPAHAVACHLHLSGDPKLSPPLAPTWPAHLSAVPA